MGLAAVGCWSVFVNAKAGGESHLMHPTSVFSPIVVALLIPLHAYAALRTTTETFQYNADGAPTAVTTQVDSGPPTTIYLTYDNFTPTNDDPTAGTVSAGNGNLLGYGPAPATGFTKQFSYDPRNRLLTADAAGAQSVSYTYHPASLLKSSTLGSGDALDFYYDMATMPMVSNIFHSSTSTWSTYLGDTTYFSNGDEQVRCQPRKDVDGVYDAASQTFSVSRYDPYGALVSPADDHGPGAGDASYDMRQNPFQYSGEYKDSSWNGYYMRARWYLPELNSFMSRDPIDPIERYGYTGGNPINRRDPSGMSYKSFSRKLAHFFSPLTGGVMGYITPFIPIVGQVAGGAVLAANLPQIWHHPGWRTYVNFAFLSTSVMTELSSHYASGLDRLGGSATRGLMSRAGIDLIIGVPQTVLAGYHNKKWDVAAVVQSMEYNLGGILDQRAFLGVGYNTHTMTAYDIDRMAAEHFADGAHKGEALVFKVRTPLGGSRYMPTYSNAWLDAKTIGAFHEGLIAVDPKGYVFTDVGYSNFDTAEHKSLRGISTHTRLKGFQGTTFSQNWEHSAIAPDRQFELVGSFNGRKVVNHFYDGDESFGPSSNLQRATARDYGRLQPAGYRFFSNNCHDYVNAMIGRLRQ